MECERAPVNISQVTSFPLLSSRLFREDVDSGLNGGPSFLDNDCSVGGVAPPEDGAVLRQKIKGGNNLLWAVTTDNCGH